nr:hypothetical protein [Tanacetum cinerariifolium]
MRSTRLTPPTATPTIAEAEDIILQDTIQLSLVEQKVVMILKLSKMKKEVKSTLMAKEIEKLVEGMDNVGVDEVNSSTLRQNDNQNDHDTRLDPRDSYATNDDELPIEKVSQELTEEMSQTADEAKLCKFLDEMLKQQCTSGYEHQYQIDQMQNFLKNDIVWKSRKEILVSPYPQKPTPVVQSYQRDPKAPALSLVNQDLFYPKKGNSWPEKIVLSLHKFPTVIFPDDDIEEKTSR